MLASNPPVLDHLYRVVRSRGDRRVDYVRHQQQLAYEAILTGQTGAARAALRALRSHDFARAHRAEIHLGVLRDSRSEHEDVADAVWILLCLTPA